MMSPCYGSRPAQGGCNEDNLDSCLPSREYTGSDASLHRCRPASAPRRCVKTPCRARAERGGLLAGQRRLPAPRTRWSHTRQHGLRLNSARANPTLALPRLPAATHMACTHAAPLRPFQPLAAAAGDGCAALRATRPTTNNTHTRPPHTHTHTHTHTQGPCRLCYTSDCASAPSLQRQGRTTHA
jgi:hypothetical protein